MPNLLAPELPTGGLAGTARKGGKDVLAVVYGGTILAIGAAIVLWGRKKAKELMAKQQAASTSGSPALQNLFKVS